MRLIDADELMEQIMDMINNAPTIAYEEAKDKLLNDRKKTKALPIMGTTVCTCYNCKHLLAKGMDYCPVCGYEISEAPWKMDGKGKKGR